MPEPQPDPPLSHLIERAIDLEVIDRDIYRSKELWKPMGGRGAFGGQIIAQAAWAATLSIRRDEPGTEKGMHSLHSYFLSFGSVDNPVLYTVQRLRDGRSYSTRTVLATQLGVPIFTITCSFCLPEPGQVKHQLPFPEWPLTAARGVGDIRKVPQPEDLDPTEERLMTLLERKEIPVRVRDYIERNAEERRQSSIEVRNADKNEMSALISARKSNSSTPQQMHWFRSRAPVQKDPAFNKCVLAYASDLQFIGTGARAVGLGARTNPPLGMLASLDHAMYFYDDTVDASDWLLYYMESPVVASGRGTVQGRIYKKDGTLAVICVQEGVVRAQLKKSAKL